jgi:MFS family permease
LRIHSASNPPMTTLDFAADNTNRREGLAQWTRVLCVLFFFSGFPALIYQLVWQRTLFRIFGVNIESITIVVTAFMLGLGFGSLLGGCLSKRRNVALLPLLAIIEILTGTFGIFSLAIFDQVGALTAGWPLPAMAAVNLGLVMVPTLLMGATLPLLVAHVVRHTEDVGSAVGLLYYANTLGAGAACLLRGAAVPVFGHARFHRRRGCNQCSRCSGRACRALARPQRLCSGACGDAHSRRLRSSRARTYPVVDSCCCWWVRLSIL